MSYTEIFALRFGGRVGWPTPEASGARQDCLAVANPSPSGKNVLYLHIPFCASRCRYCPYYSQVYSPDLMNAYLGALTQEIAMVSKTPYLRSTRFWCVYVGGGTPSLLRPADLERLSALLHHNFHLTADVEMTFEANPSSLSREKIKLLGALGFNRVSLGVQSFQDNVLRKLGCAHSAALAKRAIREVLDQGLILNIDLLFGLIGQTQAEVEGELRQLSADRLPHQVTLFPLRLAKGTPLAEELERRGALDLMSHNRRLLEFDGLVEKHLRDYSFLRAEAPIGYYREDSRPHRYQSVEGRIVGLGAGAGSLLEGAESVNHREVTRYIGQLGANRCPAAHDTYSTPEQARERYILLRILFMNRSLPGFREIVARRFEDYYSEPMGVYFEKVVRELERHGYVELAGGKLVFTERLWNLLAGLDIGTPSIL